jgi:hypothetical protein
MAAASSRPGFEINASDLSTGGHLAGPDIAPESGTRSGSQLRVASVEPSSCPELVRLRHPVHLSAHHGV